MSGTKDRILAAAGAVFAERGFQRTTVREIAARAGVNVAAGNYHYGSKKALYLEVLRAQFAEIRALLRERGASRPPGEIGRLSRAQLVSLLRARVNVMLDLLLGPPPGVHGTLMQREMCDPSEALPVIVEEFIAPMLGEMREIAARVEPRLDAESVERCVFSIIGQALFYRFTLPALRMLDGLPTRSRAVTRELADHITEFSLAGMERIAARRARGRQGG